MRTPLRSITQIFQGTLLPIADQGNGYLLYPSYFKKADRKSSAALNVEITEKVKKYLLLPDDILFTAKGWEHTAFLYTQTERPAVPSSAFIVMRVIQPAQLLPEYLVWYLNHLATQEKLSTLSKGTSMPSISLRDIEMIDIPVPPGAVQQSIVRIADLQQRKDMLEKKIELASWRLLQSQLLTIANQES